MPFVSKAHRSKMRQLLAEGKITPGQYAEMEQGTPANLPDRSEEVTDEGVPAVPAKKRRPSPFW